MLTGKQEIAFHYHAVCIWYRLWQHTARHMYSLEFAKVTKVPARDIAIRCLPFFSSVPADGKSK